MRFTLVFSAILLCVVPNVYGDGSMPSAYENYGLPMVTQRGPSRVQRPQQSRNSMQNGYGATNMNTNLNTHMNTNLNANMDSRGILTDGIITRDGQCRCDCRGALGGASYFNQFQSQKYENSMSPRVPSHGHQSGRFNNNGQMSQQSIPSQSMSQQSSYDPRMEHPVGRINSHNNGYNGYNEQMNSYGSSGSSSESFSNDGWGDSTDDMYGQIDEDADYQNMHSSSSSSSSSMYEQEEDNDDGPIFPNVELPSLGATPLSLDPERKIAQKDPQASMSIADKIVSQNGYNVDNLAQSSSSSLMSDSSRRNRITPTYGSTSSNSYNPGQSSSSSSKNNQNMNGQSNYQSSSFGNGFGDDDVLPLDVYPDPNSLADRIRLANEANGQHVVYNGLIGGSEHASSASSYRPKNEGMSIAERIAAANKGSQPTVSATRARPSNMNSQSSSYSLNDLPGSIANSGRSNVNSHTSSYSSNDLASSITKNSRSNMQQSPSTMTSSATSTSTSSNTDSGSSNSNSNSMLVDDDSLMLPSIGSPSALLNRRNDKLPSPNSQ